MIHRMNFILKCFFIGFVGFGMSNAFALSSYYANGFNTYGPCEDCHTAGNINVRTCKGCHFHAVGKSGGNSNPIQVTTDKTTYQRNETINVTISGGDQDDRWSRLNLYDSSGSLLTSTNNNCNSTSDACDQMTDLGATLQWSTATPGTYDLYASWLGHEADIDTTYLNGAMTASEFGAGYRIPNSPANHVESILSVGQITVLGNIDVNVSADTNEVKIGDEITLTITLTNNTVSDVTGVEFHDTIPSQFSIVSFEPASNCNESGGIVSCNWDSLAIGASETVTIVLNADSSGDAQNTAYALGTGNRSLNSGEITTNLVVKSNKRKVFGSTGWVLILASLIVMGLRRKIKI